MNPFALSDAPENDSDIALDKEGAESYHRQPANQVPNVNVLDNDMRMNVGAVGGVPCPEAETALLGGQGGASAEMKDIFELFKDTFKSLTVKVITFNGIGSATLIHSKIWCEYRKSRRQKREHGKTSDDLILKVNKKLIGSDLDASQAVVEFEFAKGSDVQRIYINRCSKGRFEIEGCSLLVCHDVSLDACQHLERTYKELCCLATCLSREPSYLNMFLIIGHPRGNKKKTLVFNFKTDNTERSDSYQYSSLEESADHYLIRTMNVDEEHFGVLSEKMFPGDQSLSVIRLGHEGTTYTCSDKCCQDS